VSAYAQTQSFFLSYKEAVRVELDQSRISSPGFELQRPHLGAYSGLRRDGRPRDGAGHRCERCLVHDCPFCAGQAAAVRRSGRLVRLYGQSPDDQYPWNNVAAGVFAEWKKLNTSFTDIALCGYASYNLSEAGQQLPESVRAATFSSNMLPMLGVQPALGRNFSADEDKPSANPTVLLSWGLWKRRFGGNPSIVNQDILLDGKPYTVIGVMPGWFSYPDAATQLWTPVYYNEPLGEMRSLELPDFRVIGRLKPGASLTEAVAELSLITRRLHDQHRDLVFMSKTANGRPLLDSIVGEVKMSLYALLAATGCVLLIACLNVANLLVARAAERNKELAIRMALGGSPLRLLRQHLMESLLLSAAGGVAGSLLAYWLLKWVVNARPDMARVEAIQMDGTAALFALGLIVLCATFAGLLSSSSACTAIRCFLLCRRRRALTVQGTAALVYALR
jgi:predicted permease